MYTPGPACSRCPGGTSCLHSRYPGLCAAPGTSAGDVIDNTVNTGFSSRSGLYFMLLRHLFRTLSTFHFPLHSQHHYMRFVSITILVAGEIGTS